MMPEVLITVTFHISSEHIPKVGCIEISVPANSIDKRGTSAKERYVNIAKNLHKKLSSDRTIMDLGISLKRFSWQDEVKRLKKGEITGNYFLDLTENEN